MGHHDQKDGPSGDYPGAPRRASERYAVRRVVELRCEGWTAYREVKAKNVSQQGLLLEGIETPPQAGQRATVRIASPAGARAELQAVVVRVAASDGGVGFEAALHVDAPSVGSLADLLPGVETGRTSPSWTPRSDGRWSAPSEAVGGLGAPSGEPEPAPRPPAPDPILDDDGPIADLDIDALVKAHRSAAPGARAGDSTPRHLAGAPRTDPQPRKPQRQTQPRVPSAMRRAEGRPAATPPSEPSAAPAVRAATLGDAARGPTPKEPPESPARPSDEWKWAFRQGRGRERDALRSTPVPPGGESAPARGAADKDRPTPMPAAGKATERTPAAPVAEELQATPVPADDEDLRATPVPDGDLRATPVPGPEAGAPGQAARRKPAPRPAAGGALYHAEVARADAAPSAPEAAAVAKGVRQIGIRHGGGARAEAPAVVGRAAPVLGIDFGTTYSKVAVVDGGEVVLIEDEDAKAATRAAVPSVVAFDRNGACLVGEAAREMLAVSPSQVITSVKRVMGLRHSDPLAGGLLGSLACPSFAGPNDSILFDAHGQKVTVPEVCARVLEHLLKMAKRWAGVRCERAVLTLPVDFDLVARRELELAARMAGIQVEALVHEPVAAAMGCGFDGTRETLLAVYDFGGGTLDTSVLGVGQGRFLVRGAAGDRWLGGDDFDEVLARHVADQFQATSGIGLHNKVEEWQRLVFDCEEAKRWLSTLESVDVILPRAALREDGPVTLLVPVTREDFEEVSSDIIASAVEVCRQATEQAGVEPTSVDALLVTGGTTRIPTVRIAAEEFFGREAAAGIHPEHAVVIGAAVRAAAASGAELPKDFMERLGRQGSLGMTIGLALAGGVTEHVIEARQKPPVAAHRRYATSRAGQTSLRLEIVEGASQVTGQNRRIGGFVIEGLPPREAGAITIDVYFELASTATLNVTAVERASGRRATSAFDLSSL